MSQIEVTKVVGYVATGIPASITASKVVGYMLLYPGQEAGAGDPTPKSSFTYAQVFRR